MTKVRDWLPAEVAARAPVSTAIEAAVRDWSERWFARRSVKVETIAVAAGRADLHGRGEPWRAYCGVVALRSSKPSRARLTGAALDVDLDHAILTEADRPILRAFEQKLLSDLCATIEHALGLPGELLASPREVSDPYGRAGGAEVTLADGIGSIGLSIAVPLDGVTALCKSALPPKRERSEPLAGLLASLTSTNVAVEAALGEVTISMAELQDLAAGDVLTLPTSLGGSAELRITGSETLIGRGRLTEAAGDRAILLVSD